MYSTLQLGTLLRGKARASHAPCAMRLQANVDRDSCFTLLRTSGREVGECLGLCRVQMLKKSSTHVLLSSGMPG